MLEISTTHFAQNILAQLGDGKWRKAGWPAFGRKADDYFIILSQPLASG